MPGVTLIGLGRAACVEYADPALIRGGTPSWASDAFASGATLHRVVHLDEGFDLIVEITGQPMERLNVHQAAVMDDDSDQVEG